jgi:phosphoglycerate dehydrogenase-like enzyme
MRVLAWSPNITPERAAAAGAEAAGLEDLLAASDAVTLHLVLAEGTRGLLDRARLAAMRPGAILVNTSRGPLVDEAALVDAVRSGRLRAALDVFDAEPLPAGHPLLALPGAVLTPHLGYGTHEVFAQFYGESLENVLAYLDGAPVRVLNPDVLGPRDG